MIAYAAVDVLEGRAVRLRRGLRAERTDYGEALEALLRWADAGLEEFHVVDLGAAFGEAASLTALLPRALRLRPAIRVQAAGGLRSAGAALRAVEAGAARVVLGSVLFSDPEEAARAVEVLGPRRCVAAMDVGPEGQVRTSGWLSGTGASLGDALELSSRLGFREALVTGIGRDGTLQGPDLALYAGGANHASPSRIASGGIRGAADLRALSALPGVTGAVVGKALYEGLISPGEMREASS